MPPPKKIDEKTIVEKYVNGDAGIVEIAKQYGVCHKTIKRVLLNHGITVKSGGTITPKAKRDEAKTMYESGLPIKTIAKNLGIWGEKLKRLAQQENWSAEKQKKNFDPEPNDIQLAIDLYKKGGKIDSILS